MSTIDLSFFDRNHFIVFPKPPLRPVSSQDVKYGIVVTGLESSLWQDFIEAVEAEFEGDYDPAEERLCVYFHKGPRIDEGIWNRVWAFTDDGRPLELSKLDVALVPRSVRAPSTRASEVSSLSGVSAFLSNLTSEPPPSEISSRNHCRVLPRFLTEITPQESVSQISTAQESDIPSEAVSLISRAEKDVLQWKAKKLDAITREFRAIQIGSKAGLSTATIRDILGPFPAVAGDRITEVSVESDDTEVPVESVGSSLLSIATSTAIPALLTLTLVTLSLRAASPTSAFPPLRQLHQLLTSSASRTPSAATVIYRTAKPMTGFSPHNLTFLVPFLVVGSAVVGWNVLCKELGVEFSGIWGKAGLVGRVLGNVDDGFEVDWDGVREFFGMIEG